VGFLFEYGLPKNPMNIVVSVDSYNDPNDKISQLAQLLISKEGEDKVISNEYNTDNKYDNLTMEILSDLQFKSIKIYTSDYENMHLF
jgi:hypothetical protein